MKYQALLLFFSFYLINLASCKKDEPAAVVNLLDHEIRLTNKKTNECNGTYKYDSLNRILSRTIYSCGDDGRFIYTYSDNSIIPSEIKLLPPVSFDYTTITTLDFDPPILTTNATGDMGTYTRTYVLDDDLRVLSRIRYYNNIIDTLEVYNYQNGFLQSIISSDPDYGKDKYFHYNTNNQLTEIEIVNHQSSTYNYKTIFTYKNGLLSSWGNQYKNQYVLWDYKYSSGKLSQIHLYQDIQTSPDEITRISTVSPYSYFEPMELNPINIYIYPYLELRMLQ